MDTKEKVPTRKKILIAAEEVFSENGFHKTLVEDISNRAGIGKGTIYRYFENKRELFISLMMESIDELKEIVLSESEKPGITTEKFKAGLKAYLEFFKQHKKLFAILIQEHSEAGCEDHSECFEKYMNHIKLFNEFIQGGIDDGTFKEMDPETISYGVLGVVNYLIFKWMMSRVEYDIMDEMETITDLIFRGILK